MNVVGACRVCRYHDPLGAAQTLGRKVFCALAYTSCARMHELFPFTLNDIDLENGRLIIANREGTADMPPFHVKDHEVRRIQLLPHTIELLTQLQTQAPEEVPYILLDKKHYELVKAKWDIQV